MKEVFIYGCGGVGNELAVFLKNSTEYIVQGFVDDNPKIRECMGLRSRTLDELLSAEKSNSINVIISIGEPIIRKVISEKLRIAGVKEVVVNMSDCFNPHYSSVGEGTLLHVGSFISVNSSIGKSCMINKGVMVGHDCRIGDYTVISPRSVLGGNVTVGDNTFIGTGALIRNGITIGSNVIIGMGSVVVKDVEDDSVVFGNPARFVRKNDSQRVFGKH